MLPWIRLHDLQEMHTHTIPAKIFQLRQRRMHKDQVERKKKDWQSCIVGIHESTLANTTQPNQTEVLFAEIIY